MDVDATQALDFTDDDETDDEFTERVKQPVTVYSCSHHRLNTLE